MPDYDGGLIAMGVLVREQTPGGAGGVSVLSLEGAGAQALVESWAGVALRVGDLRLVRVAIEGEQLDEALVCVMGSESVELHVHGSPPLVRSLLRMGGAEQPASDPSLEERALACLAKASSETAARVLLDQAEGALRRELERLLALNDEARRKGALELSDRSLALRYLFEPPRVLLAGPVNAGKSTLFNALLGGERAITSAEEGTTRDLLEEPAQIGEWAVRLVDSAGLRALDAKDPAAMVERAGQATGQRAAGTADLVLWLDPPETQDPPALGEVTVVRIPSRGDLEGDDTTRIQPVEEPQAALRIVESALVAALQMPDEAWIAGAPVAFDGASRELLKTLANSHADDARSALDR